MKRSAEHSRLPDPKTKTRAGGVSPGLVWIALALASQTAACVSSQSYNDVVAQRDALAETAAELNQRAGKLEVSNASLEAERVRIYDELEDLRIESEALWIERADLEQDVAHLSETKVQLSEKLESTNLALNEASANVRALQSTYQGLVDDLESELQKGAIEIEQLRSGLRVAVSDDILFRSGSATLDREGVKVLETVASHIKKLDYAVDVEGHTDNRQIHGSLAKRYPSNWELAGARAASVVRLFESAGIEGARLQAISRAEHAPVASNDDNEGRGLNRRIEIRLRPRESSEVVSVGGAVAGNESSESNDPDAGTSANSAPDES
jgi:chemotaxis protein MotB